MTLRPSDNRPQGGRTRAHFVVPAVSEMLTIGTASVKSSGWQVTCPRPFTRRDSQSGVLCGTNERIGI
jgi:hypothetical protein